MLLSQLNRFFLELDKPHEPTAKEYPTDLNSLQVEELEMTKTKATDLLKAYDGDAGSALRAYITPVV